MCIYFVVISQSYRILIKCNIFYIQHHIVFPTVSFFYHQFHCLILYYSEINGNSFSQFYILYLLGQLSNLSHNDSDSEITIRKNCSNKEVKEREERKDAYLIHVCRQMQSKKCLEKKKERKKEKKNTHTHKLLPSTAFHQLQRE